MTKIDVDHDPETGTRGTDIAHAVVNEKGIVREVEVESAITMVADIEVLKEIRSTKIATTVETKIGIKTNQTNDDRRNRT